MDTDFQDNPYKDLAGFESRSVLQSCEILFFKQSS